MTFATLISPVQTPAPGDGSEPPSLLFCDMYHGVIDPAVTGPSTGAFSLAWLIIVLPLFGALALLLLGKRSNAWGHWLAILMSVGSFAYGLALFISLLGVPGSERSVRVWMFNWLATQDFTINMGLQIDTLSILFVLLITGVGSLIHIYAVGYMAHDANRRKFFAYLNLFLAAMLTLVLADNYVILFFGWEGVGLCSYLLIGFWADRPSAAKAGNKAFIMNRIGDFGMIIALSIMLMHLGTTQFNVVNDQVREIGSGTVTLLGFALLLGACAKSAQVPLQAWLLDAMEGPTPVSALIHAATMVTAGVYLVVRSGAIFQVAPAAELAVAIIGTITLLAGAWIGCAKDDIKKVLAGSTMSQIGYMMLAAGIGPVGYPLAIFHLITHGFFKANMFLGAGSVMHGTNDDVNMRHFGGLRKAMPWTFLTFSMGYLAIIGFPGFSGYFSKDHIIEAAFEHNALMGSLALIGAGVTAFYMTRLMIMTFTSQPRWVRGVTPHESPWIMVVPLIILAIFSIGLGAVLNNWIGDWLTGTIGGVEAEHTSLWHMSALGALTLLVVIIGIVVAWQMYRKGVSAEPSTNIFAKIGQNDLYGDVINNYIAVKPTMALTRLIVKTDKDVIDAAIDKGSLKVLDASFGVRRTQNGYVRSYAFAIVAGVVIVSLALIFGYSS